MKKVMSLVLAVAFFAAFSVGCTGMVSKEAKVKCPKCGAVFSIDEGIKNMPGSAG